ncbi:MAG TPA: alcohol dehydrogenase AdhP [Parachlamydiales bacterium]|nr:MAG: zinc-dependent alcohol dehydrogenase [Chlamydiae bacterium GWA2_50_15]OGN55141.1 MAG: zinc-dependent alcohol dehydrogenase [Chlamydiae bacterium GWF2_49_8]OGN57446.1 MAG: zinc-dependent alcohol dehydrogenase [Chlamydiae bacterium RIFCSPHIGHO2_02_FULL_49_29]OGN63556.1 MAG: zinc-dependent alcohol dehydrogenase [Chlamydiae bacterium RIFCSPHIGHO2_12_FULL_49_32]OGN68423.1 MAG: zinc-dependent alcohol dehydrogenase [Chlamydiae bacterium RIFCSPLOWO2_02_FULL_49_12]OGN73767.1 MAG: zinc-dependent
MKAAVVHAFDKPLVVEDVAKPTPGPGEVIVKMETSGICHTDIHAAHGDWPVKPKLPFIPGHEGIGIVESIGSQVTEVKEGDRVALPWLGYACGSCEYCVSGWETLCLKQLNTGYAINGSYGEYAKAFAKYVGKVPKGIDPKEAAPLTCAGVTTYKAVKMSGARSSDLVAIFGVGGLGHLALQYAKIAGATVAAVDLFDDKLKMAKELGADLTINASKQDPVKELQKLGGADAVVCTAVSPKSFEQGFYSLRRGGTLVFVGLPKENLIQIPIFQTVLGGIHIVGSIVGNRLDLAEVFELHAAGRTKVYLECRKLETINECFHEVETGKIPARLVIDYRK